MMKLLGRKMKVADAFREKVAFGISRKSWKIPKALLIIPVAVIWGGVIFASLSGIFAKNADGASAAPTVNVANFSELQAAAASGGVINITASFEITATVNFTGNATLESLNGATLSRSSAFTNGSLITVANGGNLTLNDGLTLDGKNISTSVSGGIVTNSGTLILDGATIENGVAAGFGGGVYNTGTFTMKSGSISANLSNYVGGGVANQGTFEMSGGEISRNVVQGGYSWGGGIYTEGKVDMDGGKISDNTAGNIATNSGVGGGIIVNNNGVVNLNGGEISGNSGGAWGGGVGLLSYNGGSMSTLNITGGVIAKNQAVQGGGVALVATGKSKLTMNGGEIRENHAVAYLDASGSSTNTGIGGGISIWNNGQVNEVDILAGTISGNSADNLGGGIYVGDGQKLSLSDTIINENSATVNGGGIWSCPNGSVEQYVTDGGAIFANSAASSGDMIFLVAPSDSNSATMFISAGTLGGGTQTTNYDDGTDLPLSAAITADKAIGISNSMDQDSINFAKDQARVFISNNKSASGGGIATNGDVEIGSAKSTALTLKKTWNLPAGDEIPDSVEFDLVGTSLADGSKTTLKTITLTADDDWTATITDLPTGEYSYQFVERGGYKNTISVGDPTTTTTTVITPDFVKTLQPFKRSASHEVDGSRILTATVNPSPDGNPITYTLFARPSVDEDPEELPYTLTFSAAENWQATLTLPADSPYSQYEDFNFKTTYTIVGKTYIQTITSQTFTVDNLALPPKKPVVVLTPPNTGFREN